MVVYGMSYLLEYEDMSVKTLFNHVDRIFLKQFVSRVCNFPDFLAV